MEINSLALKKTPQLLELSSNRNDASQKAFKHYNIKLNYDVILIQFAE